MNREVYSQQNEVYYAQCLFQLKTWFQIGSYNHATVCWTTEAKDQGLSLQFVKYVYA